MIRPKTTVRRTSGGPEERDPVERGTEPDPDRTRLLGTPNRDSRGKGAQGARRAKEGRLGPKSRAREQQRCSRREAFSRTDRNGRFSSSSPPLPKPLVPSSPLPVLFPLHLALSLPGSPFCLLASPRLASPSSFAFVLLLVLVRL